ncbi:hypothetical protein [Bradyrhizobium sp. LHD-71]|uniref:hypothetical protein n=1 Tax=Bradyrhizobium sp. LHD-71 TaxID=3072141 RepID=UPI00280E18BF|nr:hypothetical protein [Bradyrhizobium sp. LHD-71]MDQ8732553.1 hypothetical protein [Bradyrhizobium sp. LHD-71]
MSIAFNLIIALVATAPILVLMQGPTELAFVALISALALVLGASTTPVVEFEALAKTLRRIGVLLAVPAGWMVVQLLPLPLAPPSHQIWTSAAAAMPDLSFGHITVNVIDTVRALALYCSWIVLALATMVATTERRRAELCLVTLVLVTTVIAAAGIAFSFDPSTLTVEAKETFSAAASAAVFGCVLSLAAVQRLIERREAQRPSTRRQAVSSILLTICNVSAFAICFAAAALLSPAAWIAASLGSLTFAAIALTNRLRSFKGAQYVIMTVFALTAAIVLLAKSAGTPTGAILTDVVSSASAESIAAAERMLKDTTWLGSGAGTYQTMIPVYEELGRPPPAIAPSLALKLAIELGWVFAAVLTFGTLLLAAKLIDAAMTRRRDSFYPAAAAACLASLTLQAFGDASLLNPAIGLLCAVIVGLALAQAARTTVSRTTRQTAEGYRSRSSGGRSRSLVGIQCFALAFLTAVTCDLFNNQSSQLLVNLAITVGKG